LVSGAAVANLAAKYYSLASPQPFLNITLTETPFASLSSSFMIDAISIYMAILFIAVSAVVIFYSIFFMALRRDPQKDTSP